MNNAAIELAPDRIAAVTGLRAMAQGLGSTFGISFALLMASRAETQGGGLEMAFTIFSVMLIIATALLIRWIPEMGSRRVVARSVETSSPVARPRVQPSRAKSMWPRPRFRRTTPEELRGRARGMLVCSRAPNRHRNTSTAPTDLSAS